MKERARISSFIPECNAYHAVATKEDIERAIVQGDQEDALFVDKSHLDGVVQQGTPVSRAPKVGELAKAIA